MTIFRTDPPGIPSAPGLISQVAYAHDHDLIFVSGQVAWNEGHAIQGVGDHGVQAAKIAENIDVVLASLGTTRDSIIKETIYVVDWRPELLPVIVGSLRNGGAVPASTLVGVGALVDPEALLEVEIVLALPRRNSLAGTEPEA